ncbi:HipA domain-containing protein [Bifidobacterium oedipodis]|nr:HipA domain-containing protein [Bifidobacterium sp. DSM 109957]
MELANFEGAPLSGRFYGGDAGRKVGVTWNGADWILKYPGPTRHLEGSVPSYTSAPLSEYLGSHVYAMLGVPVHDTMLGIRDGKLVCACHDFTDTGRRLVEFHDLKNSLSDDEPGFSEAPSSGRGVVLADVRAALHRIPILMEINGVVERFWNMFVIDAFIRNIDRNNTNWGILTGGGQPAELAPVYDNGSSFFNKRTDGGIDRRLSDADLIRQDAFDVRSCYTDDRGKPIAPLKYIASGQDEDCNKAFARFMERYDADAFDTLLDMVPDQAYGVTVMTDEYREYHRRVMRYRYESIFVPTWKSR